MRNIQIKHSKLALNWKEIISFQTICKWDLILFCEVSRVLFTLSPRAPFVCYRSLTWTKPQKCSCTSQYIKVDATGKKQFFNSSSFNFQLIFHDFPWTINVECVTKTFSCKLFWWGRTLKNCWFYFSLDRSLVSQ